MAVVAVTQIDESVANPIDLIEQFAGAHGWSFDRGSDNELVIEVTGQWADYRLFFSWLDDLWAIHFACAFDMTVPDHRRAAINELLARINERMAVGHFDLWADRGLPVFRQSTLLRGAHGLSVEQLEDLVEIALAECERFYPSFQYVIWGGKTPVEAVEAAMIETVGEA
ncbi:YbjN domain-containing protein [Alphaproteobacteria bacterium]|nr:YbjN domain-containing protein [Alphaproteobacteria bacterium]